MSTTANPDLSLSVANMRGIFLESLKVMEGAFRRLEKKVPAPMWLQQQGDWMWRYKEQNVYQAILQKLARQVSGLYAIDVLLLNGLVQEQAVLQRTLDEIGEDIIFLALALTNDTITALHERYLETFWEEEFDDPDPLKATQKRGMVPRKSIRAYNARVSGLPDPHAAHVAGATVYKTFSGYVHAASPHIMDMVGGGDPPLFHLKGMLGTPRIRENVQGAWNYFLRGLMSFTVAAKAFGDAELVDELYRALDEFQKTEAR